MLSTLGTDPSLVRTSQAILPRLMEHLFAHFARVCVRLPSFLIGQEFVFRTFLPRAAVLFSPRFWTDDSLDLFLARRTHHLPSRRSVRSLPIRRRYFRFVLSFLPFKRFLSTWGSIPIHPFQLPFHPRRGPFHRNPWLGTMHAPRHRHTYYMACGCDATSRRSASIHLSSPWTSARWRWMLDPSNRRTEMGALRRPTAPPPSGCNCFHGPGVTAPMDRSLASPVWRTVVGRWTGWGVHPRWMVWDNWWWTCRQLAGIATGHPRT